MKNTDPLERLLRAAAAAWPAAEEPRLSLTTEARILRVWRRGPVERDDVDWLRMFRRGLAFAGIIALAVVALSVNRMPGRSADVYTTANAIANLAVLP